jgi:hypothetical protein
MYPKTLSDNSIRQKYLDFVLPCFAQLIFGAVRLKHIYEWVIYDDFSFVKTKKTLLNTLDKDSTK